MVRAVYVEATDVLFGGGDGERLILLTAGAVMRGVKSCGAGTGLLIAWFRQTEVRTAPIISAAGVGGPS